MGDSSEFKVKQYKAYYDVIRLMAIFLVVFNHTPAYVFSFGVVGGGFHAWMMMLVTVLDKVAVPLFFMISGALLLFRHESIMAVLRNRIMRFVGVILLYHVVQSSYYMIGGGENSIGFRSFIGDCYWGSCSHGYVLASVTAVTVWFLYAYLGFLLMLPFLRSMVAGMTRNHFLYLFALQTICCVLMPVGFVMVTGFSSADSGLLKYLPLCTNMLVFVLAGYYVENRVDLQSVTAKNIGWMIFASIIIVGMVSVYPTMEYIRTGTFCVDPYVSIAMSSLLVPCMVLVIVLRKLFEKIRIPSAVCRVLRCCGAAVFTVMLLENILREWISSLFPGYATSYLPSIWVSGIVCLVGVGVGLVLKQLPLLKKLL